MSIIIPYDENLIKTAGAYFTPQGNIIDTWDHEQFARDYCLGPLYDELNSIKQNPDKYDIDTLRKEYNISSIESIKNLDIYRTSKLNENEMQALKEYEKSRFFENTYNEFLMNIKHYDKIETYDRYIKKAIDHNINGRIFSDTNEPHIRFWNYYLMGWKLDTPYICFFWHQIEHQLEEYSVMVTKEDIEAQKELDDIKRRVRTEDRPVFFKK